MKLQCSCGAKYVFEATPEMLQNPVKFICPSCGLDASEFVNQLIRQEMGSAAPAPAAAPVASAPPPPPPAAGSRLKISHEAAPAAAAATEAAPASKMCPKHRERATEQCAVCHKPICPKCMELFGYFCSPLCKGKAEAQHLDVPVFEGRKDLVEAKFWRKVGLVAGGIGGAIALFVGLWTWYAWFGSVPHPYFAVRFEDNDRGYSGDAQLVGKEKGELIFLHGGTLARYDLKSKKEIWKQELITRKQIDDRMKEENESEARANAGFGYHSHRSQESIEREVKQDLQRELTLRVSGQNIWVEKRGKMMRYDWDSGNVVKEITLPELEGELVEAGDELQVIGAKSVTHISLADGAAQIVEFGPAGARTVQLAQNDAGGGLPGTIADNGGTMDPKKVEAQVQNMKIQGKAALPAIIANAQHEKQIEAALNDDPRHPRPKGKGIPDDAVLFQLVPGETGYAQVAFQMLEEKIVTRTAMKAPPKKTVLDSGNVNAMNEMQAINEQLNEMQRGSGGGEVRENQSRYKVTVHLPDSPSTPDWVGEVIGPPQLFVLKSVNVVAAGKSVTVLDKNNKKLWEATLTYTMSGGEESFFMRTKSKYGDGPCVEHGDTLYVFDEAVLTAFDLNSGDARWRLPSVGVVGLFFDDKGDVYVNTTTGSPDDVKYSRQIDVTRNIQAVLTKVDPKTGKALWTAKPGGFVSYLSGKFIYVIDCYDPNPGDEEETSDITLGLQKPAFLKITRIRPSDGKIMWDYYDRNRCPVTWNFDGKSIQLVFKREVQVLRYLTF